MDTQTADPMDDLMSVQTWEALSILPDGSIISWLRVPGDPSSRAVAFLNRDIDPDTGEVVHWVSPGGWSPMTPDQAGINYPVQIVLIPNMLGGVAAEAIPEHAEPPAWDLHHIDYAEQIGADTRRACLQMAVHWTARWSVSASAADLFAMAEQFADYIRDGRRA